MHQVYVSRSHCLINALALSARFDLGQSAARRAETTMKLDSGAAGAPTSKFHVRHGPRPLRFRGVDMSTTPAYYVKALCRTTVRTEGESLLQSPDDRIQISLSVACA
jgi:hypothetical protein